MVLIFVTSWNLTVPLFTTREEVPSIINLESSLNSKSPALIVITDPFAKDTSELSLASTLPPPTVISESSLRILEECSKVMSPFKLAELSE